MSDFTIFILMVSALAFIALLADWFESPADEE